MKRHVRPYLSCGINDLFICQFPRFLFTPSSLQAHTLALPKQVFCCSQIIIILKTLCETSLWADAWCVHWLLLCHTFTPTWECCRSVGLHASFSLISHTELCVCVCLGRNIFCVIDICNMVVLTSDSYTLYHVCNFNIMWYNWQIKKHIYT